MPSSKSSSVFVFLAAMLLMIAAPYASAATCGGKNQRPCKLWERIPSCNKGLVEDFAKGRCVAKVRPGVDCGKANQRPCKIWERVPSCNKNLKEDFAKGICVAVNCGKRNGRPCNVWERIPSCDAGLVENFLKHKCVDSGDAKRYDLAKQKLDQLGGFILDRMQYAIGVSLDPQVAKRLGSGTPAAAADVINMAPVTERQLPELPLRTMTVGVMAGGRFIFVGSSGSTGVAIDLLGRMPVHAYASGDYSWGPGLGAGAGVDVGFWVCQNNKIGGDVWGVEFGIDDFLSAKSVITAGKGARVDELKKLFKSVQKSFNAGLWFDYNNVFQGFTITPGGAVGLDLGGVLYASTAVKGDDSVGCDGKPVAQARAQTLAASGPKVRIQNISVGKGTVMHQKIVGGAPRPDMVRICLENHTGREKSLAHGVTGINPLRVAPGNGQSCANFSKDLRLEFAFVDANSVKKRDAMSLGAYAGDLVLFDWLKD